MTVSPPPPRKRRRLSSPALPSIPPPQRQATIPPAAPDYLRVYSWNINGIASFLPSTSRTSFGPQDQRPITTFFPNSTSPATEPSLAAKPKSSAPSLKACLRRWNYPEIVCLQEVKIRANDEGTKRAFERALNPPRSRSSPAADNADIENDDRDGHGPNYSLHFSLPRDAHNARGFGGRIYGVATLIREDIVTKYLTRTQSVEWDREGRVLVTELRDRSSKDKDGKEERGLLIMNIYAVNGTDNIWRSSDTGEVLGTRHDAKIAFHQLLAKEWRFWQEERGMDVLVAGDLNVARDERDGWPGIRLGVKHVINRKDFNERFFGEKGVGAVDAFREVHGDERRYTYRPRGRPWGESCDRVDLCMVSKGIVSEGRLVGADILDSEVERGPSDHVPLYVTVKIGGGGDEGMLR